MVCNLYHFPLHTVYIAVLLFIAVAPSGLLSTLQDEGQHV
jgi:hypothetical protein